VTDVPPPGVTRWGHRLTGANRVETTVPRLVHRTIGTAAALACTTLAILPLTACGDEVDVSTIATSPNYTNASYPLDRYQLTPGQQQTLAAAKAVIGHACLKRFGIDVPVPTTIKVRSRTPADRYGIADADVARARGYRAENIPVSAAEFEFVVPTAGPAAVAVYYGRPLEPGQARPTVTTTTAVPDGGCAGETARILWSGTQPPADDLVADLERQALTAATTDPRVQQLIPRWRRCMDRAGYRYQDPYDAVRRWQGRPIANENDEYGTQRPTREEVVAALTDVHCKNTTGLLATWIATNVDHQQREVAANQQALDAHRASLDIVVRNAIAAHTDHPDLPETQ
jgi:hypothetical protein